MPSHAHDGVQVKQEGEEPDAAAAADAMPENPFPEDFKFIILLESHRLYVFYLNCAACTRRSAHGRPWYVCMLQPRHACSAKESSRAGRTHHPKVAGVKEKEEVCFRAQLTHGGTSTHHRPNHVRVCECVLR